MGRRSINTTKSGKYMNPTDQARKEARKQELKKNKKQRQMVRAAVLKGKDPHQILEEMEKIDQMEYNVQQPSPLNEKVLKDKRKKLRDTLDRVLSMYYKDDQDKWSELKKRQTEYESKRTELVTFFESVKSAQQVTVDEIPLPQIPQQAILLNTPQIPLPTTERKPEHTIYSIATALKLQALGQPVKEPPGCPPGPPPIISEDGEVEEFTFKFVEEEKEAIDNDEVGDAEQAIVVSSVAPVPMPNKPTSLQQKMVALSGQNVDDFMKEMEVVQKKLETAKQQIEQETRAKHNIQIEPLLPPGTTEPLPTFPSNPPTLMYPGGIRLPAGPPPGRPLLPPGPPPGLPLRMPPSVRLPPPSIAQPRIIRLPGPPLLANPGASAVQVQPNVLSAAPQLINRSDSTKQGATISAKPQIRNLSADVTRFVPSALRVKREEKKMKPTTSLVRELKKKEMNLSRNLTSQHNKDDAYKMFMQEMEGLM